MMDRIWKCAGKKICNHLDNSVVTDKVLIGKTIDCIGALTFFIKTKLLSSIKILFVALKLSYFKFAKSTKCSLSP